MPGTYYRFLLTPSDLLLYTFVVFVNGPLMDAAYDKDNEHVSR
jgi:hypothetical protein